MYPRRKAHNVNEQVSRIVARPEVRPKKCADSNTVVAQLYLKHNSSSVLKDGLFGLFGPKASSEGSFRRRQPAGKASVGQYNPRGPGAGALWTGRVRPAWEVWQVGFLLVFPPFFNAVEGRGVGE